MQLRVVRAGDGRRVRRRIPRRHLCPVVPTTPQAARRLQRSFRSDNIVHVRLSVPQLRPSGVVVGGGGAGAQAAAVSRRRVAGVGLAFAGNSAMIAPRFAPVRVIVLSS